MCKHLVLATSSCDKGHEDMMVSESWKLLIDRGATVLRLDNTLASTSELAITIVAKDQSVSHAECLELRRRQAKWHTGTALTCLPVCPFRFTRFSSSDSAGSPPPLKNLDHPSKTAPLAFDHDLTLEDIIIALV